MVKGQTVCRFNTLDDGIRFGIHVLPIHRNRVYLGVSSSAPPDERRLFKNRLTKAISLNWKSFLRPRRATPS